MTIYQSAIYHGRAFAGTLAKEPARPAKVREHNLAPWLVVATVCFGAFMGQLDASIVTLAFPSLEHNFHTQLANVQWVSLAYLITLVIALVPAGRFSDRVGRKLVYLYGFAVFTAASALCGLASSLLMLIVLRVLQAAGAAMLQSNSVALVSLSVSGGQKRTALGIQAAAQSLGLTLGPVLGGLLVTSAGWQSIFFINVPVGLVAFVAGWFLLPRTRERAESQPGDVPGLLLLAVASITMLVFVSGISGQGIPGTALVALAMAAVASVIALWRREHRARFPLIDIRSLRSSGAAGLLAGALCAYLVLFGPLVLFTQVMVMGGESVLKAGLLLGALPLGFGAAAVGGEFVFPRNWPDAVRVKLGAAVTVASATMLALAIPDVMRILLLAALGIGLGVYIPANNAVLMSAVPKHRAATTGGMVNIARGLGTSFGVAAVTLGLGLAAQGHPSRGQAIAMIPVVAAAVGMMVAARRGARHGSGSGDAAGKVEAL